MMKQGGYRNRVSQQNKTINIMKSVIIYHFSFPPAHMALLLQLYSSHEFRKKEALNK